VSVRKPIMPTDTFSAVEARIAVTHRRSPQFPVQHATLIRLVRHITKRSQDMTNLALKPQGLNIGSYNLLIALYGTEDNRLSASELADATSEKRTNVTRICDELFAKGLIARETGATDRRSVEVSLTRAGTKLIESLMPTMQLLLHQVYGNLNATEMKQLSALLRKQLVAIDQHIGANSGGGDEA
jgi:MarR family transcriptional repressor of emrRAB